MSHSFRADRQEVRTPDMEPLSYGVVRGVNMGYGWGVVRIESIDCIILDY